MSMAPFLHVVEERVMIWGLGRAVSVARQISEKVQNDSSNPDKSAKTRPDKVATISKIWRKALGRPRHHTYWESV